MTDFTAEEIKGLIKKAELYHIKIDDKTDYFDLAQLIDDIDYLAKEANEINLDIEDIGECYGWDYKDLEFGLKNEIEKAEQAAYEYYNKDDHSRSFYTRTWEY